MSLVKTGELTPSIYANACKWQALKAEYGLDDTKR